METLKKNLNRDWDWDTVTNMYSKLGMMPTIPRAQWLSNGHIEDSSKSAQWNAEFVKAQHRKWLNERRRLGRVKEEFKKECEEVVKFVIWDSLGQKLTENDIQRYFDEWYSRFHNDGYVYMAKMMQQEIDFIKSMDWFNKL